MRHLRAEGLWAERRTRIHGGPALFLDRDGTIVDEVDYLCRVEDVRLAPGAARTIAVANDRGMPVVMVTNQSGIARGKLDWTMFVAVQDEIHRQLGAAGAVVDAVYACAYHRDGQPPLNDPDHPWRKPNPGMALSAAVDLQLDLSQSCIVGDRAADLLAGKRAGMRSGTLVATGYGMHESERADAKALRDPQFDVRTAADLGGFAFQDA